MSNITAPNKSSRQQALGPRASFLKWGIPILIVVLTLAAFYPALQNKFVNWDDYKNIVENPHYRGLGWKNIAWMFTTFHMGHYQPLSWLTLGLDYVFWGINPFGYHLTNLILHGANAIVFYYVSFRLLSLLDATPSSRKTHALPIAAALAALFFAIHPLRVESVAWVTERRDVLSGFFFLLTILFYLKAVTVGEADSGRKRSMALSLISYVLALLSKASGITLPLVLIVLDVYPLRRLGQNPKRWLAPESREIWREKIPFLVFALGAGIVALMAQHQAKAIRPLEQYDTASRIMQSFYGVGFYLRKTILPFSLSPLYQVSLTPDPWRWSFLLSGIVVVGITVALFVQRRRWPAIFASWMVYGILLVPTSGIAQSGPQLVADRYSYLSCMVWALAGSGAIFRLWQASWNRGVPRKLFDSVVVFVALVLMGLGVLTWKQTQVWHDSEELWRHALSIDRGSSFAHNNLGNALAAQGRFEEAIDEFQMALSIDPNDPDATYNLGNALAQQGNFEAAGKQLQQALQMNPDNAMAAYDLGNVRARQGRFDEAIDQFQKALKIDPGLTRAHYNMASLLMQEGKLDEAIAHFRQVMLLAPEDGRAPYHLGQIFSRQGRLDEALRHYRLALRIDPSNLKARYYLAVALAEQGDFEGAGKEFQESLRIDPKLGEAHAGLARALSAQGKKDQAVQHYQEALRLLKSQTQNEGSKK
jgi:protein O-mannosyl-transferase